MQVNLNVMLAEGESLPMSAEEVATKVLEALGGDQEKDHCTVSVSTAPNTVSVGTLPDYTPPSAP